MRFALPLEWHIYIVPGIVYLLSIYFKWKEQIDVYLDNSDTFVNAAIILFIAFFIGYLINYFIIKILRRISFIEKYLDNKVNKIIPFEIDEQIKLLQWATVEQMKAYNGLYYHMLLIRSLIPPTLILCVVLFFYFEYLNYCCTILHIIISILILYSLWYIWWKDLRLNWKKSSNAIKETLKLVTLQLS
jgi:hypothetical protein